MVIAGNVTELVSDALTVSRLKYDCVAAVGDLCPVCISAQGRRCFRCCAVTVDTENRFQSRGCRTHANFNLTVKVPRRLFYAPSPRLFFCSLRIDRRERRMKESSSPLSLPRYCDTACDDLAAVGDTHSLSLSLLLSRGAKRSWLCKTSRRCVSVGRAHRILPLQWFTTLYRPRSHVETTPATRYTLFCVP